MQIFISIRSAGASPQRGEIIRFCDLFLVGWSVILDFFLGHAPSSNLWMSFQVYGSYDVFSPMDGPFGVATLSEFVWG